MSLPTPTSDAPESRPAESPDIRYGRALEGAHLSSYARERAAREMIHLLESGEWRHVGYGFLDPSEFVRSIPFGEFGASRDLVLAYERAAKATGATNAAIGASRGVSEAAVRYDLSDRSDFDSPEEAGSAVRAMEPAETLSDRSDFDSPTHEPEDVPLWEEPGTDEDEDSPDEPLVVAAPQKSEPEPEKPAPNAQVNEGDEWYTPRWLFDALGIRFAIDVCSPTDRTFVAVPAETWFTAEDDGLAQPWQGTVWCNPPYSRPEPWARRMIHHRDGLLLTHMPMNAGWCVDVWETCDAIRLFQAMEFVRPDGTSQRPGYWLQLAAFGPAAVEALSRLQPLGSAAENKRRVASPMWRAA